MSTIPTMRKLASIRRIGYIRPIKGADRIELARVDGWDVIVKKDEFRIGDLCLYCEIDSVLPVNNYTFRFLQGEAIRTLKMRGVVSQGICFPLGIPSLREIESELNEGDDVTELLGVTLFEDEEDGEFPFFIPRTREERVQNLADEIAGFWGLHLIATEKLDGQSVTYYLKDGKFGICSRNRELDLDVESVFREIGFFLDIEGILPDSGIPNVAIQGEIVGPKIHGNKLKLDKVTFFVFSVFDIDKQEYLDWKETTKVVEKMGLKIVPVVDGFDFNLSVDELLEKADGKSLVNPKVRREGMVIRSRFVQDVQFGKLSFKVVSNKYLLKK